MAMFICEDHGEVVASFVSKDVAAAVNARTRLDLAVITLNDGFGASAHHVDQHFVLELVKEGLLSPDTLSGVSEESSWEISCRLKPVCSDCLNEWLLWQKTGQGNG